MIDFIKVIIGTATPPDCLDPSVPGTTFASSHCSTWTGVVGTRRPSPYREAVEEYDRLHSHTMLGCLVGHASQSSASDHRHSEPQQ